MHNQEGAPVLDRHVQEDIGRMVREQLATAVGELPDDLSRLLGDLRTRDRHAKQARRDARRLDA